MLNALPGLLRDRQCGGCPLKLSTPNIILRTRRGGRKGRRRRRVEERIVSQYKLHYRFRMFSGQANLEE